MSNFKPILDSRSSIVNKGDGQVVKVGRNVRLLGARIVMAKNSKLIVGNNVIIRGYIAISENCSVEIGSHTKCNFPVNIIVSEGTKLAIGESCLLSDVSIYTSDTHSIFDKNTKCRVNSAKNIYIGNRVWLGRKSWVMKGAEISDDVVVAAAAMVTGKINKNTVCAGIPAKVIKENIVWCDERTEIAPELLYDSNEKQKLTSSNLNMDVYFLEYDLATKYTGIERSALLRSKIFVDHLNLVPQIVTYKYRSHSSTEIMQLKRKGELPNNINIINVHEYLQNWKSKNKSDGGLYFYGKTFQVPFNGKGNQLYKNNEKSIRLHAFYNPSNERLHYIVHYNKTGRWLRQFYHESGNLSCTQFLESGTARVVKENYVDSEGKTCLIKEFKYTTKGVQQIKRITLLNQYGGVELVTDKEQEFIYYVIDQLLGGKKSNVTLIVDKNRFYYKSSIKLKEKREGEVKVVSVIHNQHAIGVDKMSAPINSNYKSIFEDLSKVDAIVVQTEQQKNDILMRFKGASNIFAIPHSYSAKSCSVKNTVLYPHRAVCFARYMKDKRHDLMIRAFAKVVAVIPSAELHCYGVGGELSNLKLLVESLKLEKNIFLNNWCNNVAEEYATSALSILASPSESFAISVAESLAHGCPVIGFDVPYGLQALVVSGENGFLVPYGDIDSMSHCIIKLMQDSTLQMQFSKRSVENSDWYNEKSVAKKWSSLLRGFHNSI
ncbi:glycosyltransferase [Thiopseudomonas alkaliphila]|uniref:glycosyltransferase n=1 Tax=Thiopseudomonas alkaliphila TaxID=1697053 RepID=UPI0035715D29